MLFFPLHFTGDESKLQQQETKTKQTTKKQQQQHTLTRNQQDNEISGIAKLLKEALKENRRTNKTI